mmetsp:Transcript_7073/g.27109  ORF Transcript_7073/g.27109 Transcript_7073/m.27109 type:complete len:356 (+) Transcript_7073:343-1410(+)
MRRVASDLVPRAQRRLGAELRATTGACFLRRLDRHVVQRAAAECGQHGALRAFHPAHRHVGGSSPAPVQRDHESREAHEQLHQHHVRPHAHRRHQHRLLPERAVLLRGDDPRGCRALRWRLHDLRLRAQQVQPPHPQGPGDDDEHQRGQLREPDLQDSHLHHHRQPLLPRAGHGGDHLRHQPLHVLAEESHPEQDLQQPLVGRVHPGEALVRGRDPCPDLRRAGWGALPSAQPGRRQRRRPHRLLRLHRQNVSPLAVPQDLRRGRAGARASAHAVRTFRQRARGAAVASTTNLSQLHRRELAAWAGDAGFFISQPGGRGAWRGDKALELVIPGGNGFRRDSFGGRRDNSVERCAR